MNILLTIERRLIKIIIQLTEKAVKQLKKILSTQEGKSIRIHEVILGCACSAIPELSITLDESKDGDISMEAEGIQFIIQERLVKGLASIKIDFRIGVRGKEFIVKGTEKGACLL